MKLFNKKSITICTLIVLVLSMIIFEFGYCNVNFIKGVENEYNFSLCRIVCYAIFIILYFIYKNKFVEVAVETTKNKYKRIMIYITIIIGVIGIGILSAYALSESGNYIRGSSIGIILILSTILFIIYISNDIEKNIIVTACTFGIIFTFTTSFNHAIDEKKHFMSALNVSFLNFDYGDNPITDKSIEQLPQISKFDRIDDFLKNNYDANTTDEVNKEDIPSTPANYNILTYIFSGTGIALARMLNGSIIDMYIMGRMMNLILYTILVYIAMKLLPYKKNIFFIIAFMPYMLLLAASYSVDGICLGTIYIFVAYCLKIYKESETISLKQFLILIVLFIIMLIGKGVGYMLIGVLVFMLPLYKTIKKNKKYLPAIISAGIILVIIGTFFIIYMKNTKINSDGDSRGGNQINATEQLNMILTHPIYDVKIALEHFRVTLLNFAWLSTLHQNTFFTDKYSSATFFVMMLFILYVSFTEDDFNFKIKDKIILLLAFLFGWGMTSAILYLSFTPVGSLYIAGYQARYIFPILPLLLCCLSNDRVKCIKSENRNTNISVCTGIFLFVGLMQLIII